MRGWQALILTGVAGIIGLATGSRSIQVATLALLLVVAIGVGYRVLLSGEVRGIRTMRDSVVAWGTPFEQTFELTNLSRLPIPAIRITDQSTLPEHPHGYVTGLRAKGSITWEVDITCQRRGRYRLGPVEALMSDPLGLFPVRRQLAAASSVLVLPRWAPLKRCALKLDGFMPGEVRGRQRSESPPTVVSVRDFSIGDSMSAIHWPATARAGHLMTKLFDPLVQTTLWVALDLDGALEEHVEELLVTTAASLGIYALQRANLRAGLVASGAVPLTLPSERGKAHQYQWQEMLAEVHAGTQSQLSTQMARLDRQLGPGQVIVLLTARGPETWGAWVDRLVRRGIATRVVCVSTADDSLVAPASWSVPAIQLPLALADPAKQSALIAALEGRAIN